MKHGGDFTPKTRIKLEGKMSESDSFLVALHLAVTVRIVGTILSIAAVIWALSSVL
jgi:hypothetical protein